MQIDLQKEKYDGSQPIIKHEPLNSEIAFEEPLDSNQDGIVELQQTSPQQQLNQIIQANNQQLDYTEIEIRRIYKEMLFSILMFFLQIIILAFIMLYKLSYIALIGVGMAYDIFLFRNYFFTSYETERMKKRQRICFYDTLMLFIAKIICILTFETNFCHLYYILVILVLQIIFQSIVYQNGKDQKNCTSIYDFIVLGMKIFLLIQGLTLLLKIEDLIDWQWKEVFWSYWILFAMILGLNFGIGLMFISKLFQVFCEQLEKSEMIGTLWIVFTSFCSSFGVCIIIQGTVDYYDKHQELTVAQDEEEEEQMQNTSLAKPKKKRFKKKNVLMPQFLTKFSSTYFKRTQDKLQNQSKQSQSKKAQNLEISQIPNKTQPQNAFRQYSKQNQTQKIAMQNFSPIAVNNSANDELDHYDNPYPSLTERQSCQIDNNNQQNASPLTQRMHFVRSNMLFDKYTKKNKILQSPNRQNDPNISYTQRSNKNFQDFLQMIKKCKEQNIDFFSQDRLIKTPNNKQQLSKKVNQANQSNVNCLICFENPPDSVFMECGHGGICYLCSIDLWNATGECFLCRSKIQQVLQIDISDQNSMNADHIKVIGMTDMIAQDDEADDDLQLKNQY